MIDVMAVNSQDLILLL